MDSECASLLPRVCEVLADSRRALPDDTSLEKLLDWFTGLTKSGGCLLETCPCLLDFISSVGNNTALDPAVLSFTLKLTGLLAASEDGFKILRDCSVLDLVFKHQHWQDKGVWEDPCLRIGWIQGLKNLLQHPAALDFFVKSGFIEPLLQLQTDTSLFVASAANQTLAHALLLLHLPSSEGSNSTEEHDDEHARTSTSSDEFTVLSEYLTESLVPGDNTRLQQSLQTLRLLALLLSQAGPPLRDMLLQTVLDPLEELVKADCSLLTLSLMDAIMAAHSCSVADGHVPDQRVSRLLSSMLNSNKPSDLLQAAAAFLHRGRRDSIYTVQAVRILLLPLSIVTGHPLLGATDHLSMVEDMKSKSSCISMICVSLTNAPQITNMPSDVLPCPPDSVVSAVLSLLKICSGFSSPTARREVSRNVIGSSKVQKCALETLAALSNSTGVKLKVSDVIRVLIGYLDNPDSDPSVLHKSYQALKKWACMCTDLSLLTDQLREDLTAVVGKRACDMRWEVRDSTVEFLGHLVQERGRASASEAMLSRCWIRSLLKVALQDAESYVRASAVDALAGTLSQSCQQGAADEESEIVSRLLEILSQDAEGFSRRAVVRYFITWFSSSTPHSSSASILSRSVHAVLLQGSADLDWEVKVHTLELAQLLLDAAFSGHQSYRQNSGTKPALNGSHGEAVRPYADAHTEDDLAAALNSVVELGVISVLLGGLVDCDRPVALKACQLLMTLRETLCPLSGGLVDAVPCELPDHSWGKEIRRILRAENYNVASKAGSVDPEDRGDTHGAVSMCEVLASLGLDEKLDILSRSSDHVHNSALSLLQDILTAGPGYTHPETQPGLEVIVDCY
ncbi:integrator complex assembly factor BRAT1 isoform X2 [Takifugu rubripes]|uniref:integrator complex assembly factor BRAT1 isoform X2 n=1 Tax=Takifugu rubripes TaxID=31033 RepID=UPI001145CBCE|nr:BRCA1-associated ATM activator 1 isoform X2 [Takifugu rubripes]